jgi:hypothetical protein
MSDIFQHDHMYAREKLDDREREQTSSVDDTDGEQHTDGEDHGESESPEVTSSDKQNTIREKNKQSAQNLRNRKKILSQKMLQYLSDLLEECKEMRTCIDRRFAAQILLSLSSSDSQTPFFSPSSSVCGYHFRSLVLMHPTVFVGSALDYHAKQSIAEFFEKAGSDTASLDRSNPYSFEQGQKKRARYSSGLSQIEKANVRRERNKMHAKATRDKKKAFMELCRDAILKTEQETEALRSYLLDHNMLFHHQLAVRLKQNEIKREEIRSFTPSCSTSRSPSYFDQPHLPVETLFFGGEERDFSGQKRSRSYSLSSCSTD